MSEFLRCKSENVVCETVGMCDGVCVCVCSYSSSHVLVVCCSVLPEHSMSCRVFCGVSDAFIAQ